MNESHQEPLVRLFEHLQSGSTDRVNVALAELNQWEEAAIQAALRQTITLNGLHYTLLYFIRQHKSQEDLKDHEFHSILAAASRVFPTAKAELLPKMINAGRFQDAERLIRQGADVRELGFYLDEYAQWLFNRANEAIGNRVTGAYLHALMLFEHGASISDESCHRFLRETLKLSHPEDAPHIIRCLNGVRTRNPMLLNDGSLLHRAAFAGNFAAVKWLIDVEKFSATAEWGRGAQKKSVLYYAQKSHNVELADYIDTLVKQASEDELKAYAEEVFSGKKKKKSRQKGQPITSENKIGDAVLVVRAAKDSPRNAGTKGVLSHKIEVSITQLKK